MKTLQPLQWPYMLAVLMLITSICASTIVPSNDTTLSTAGAINLTLSSGSLTLPLTYIVPLTSDTSAASLQGSAYIATPSNYATVMRTDVVFISCDNRTSDYPGNIGPLDVFRDITHIGPIATIFYSETANRCLSSDVFVEAHTYTMTRLNDTQSILNTIKDRPTAFNAQIGALNSSNSDNSSTMGNGPAPGTALAMIILYAITGAITLLFLLIIITGAVRAHRHPEQYGPRGGGRIKQTRVGGLARAMLETIPIVKFGERAPPKPDIELADAEQPVEKSINTPEPAREDGIAAATNDIVETSAVGCSICTEDFEVGQDQRVLPCNHHFHPACVDPWLLNVSGTCPLCRIDLRPQEDEAEAEPEESAVPMSAAARRRRSVMIALSNGWRGPHLMDREERLQALRRYRERNRTSAQAVAGATDMSGATESPDATASVSEEQEPARSNRLRYLNVRTWRTPRT